MEKSYDLHLPVFKQGDDLADSIDATETLHEAFIIQAKKYSDAANICWKLSEILKNNTNVEIDAQTHHIGIHGPEEIFKDLLKSDILYESHNEEDDIDEEE